MTTYSFPSITPNASRIELLSNTRTYVSPFSGAIQTVDRGGERWIVDLTFHSLTGAEKAEMAAFLAKLNGQEHRVTLPNHAENNRGAFGGTPLVNGTSSAGTTLEVKGASTGITNWARAGDWVSYDSQLKMVTADANSDGSGLVTLSVIPKIRQTTSDDDPITTSGGAGTFMLSGKGISWANRPGDFGDFSVQFVEDIAI